MRRTLLAAALLAATRHAQAQPPPAWHQGKPPAMADSKLAPLAGRKTETPASEIPIDKLKLPKGFKAEIWATGLPGGRAMALGDDGQEVYVGTRGIGRVYEVTDEGDKRTRARGGRQADAALRRRHAERLALRVRDRQGAALRRHREQPGRAAGGHDRRVRPADGAAPQLEVHRLRPGREALRAVRRAVQHLRAADQGVRADPPLQRRRLRQGSDRDRRAQHAGLRLASEDQGALVHRPRPRLDGRQRARGRAEPHRQGRAQLRLSRTATPRASPTPTSRRPTPARA